MIINLSRDKTALVGIKRGKVDEHSAEFVMSNDHVYLKDKFNKIKFRVSDSVRQAIVNKGYLILCQNDPFEFFKVKMRSNV